MIEDDFDREELLDPEDFGVVVSMTTIQGLRKTVSGIFRNPTVEDLVGDTTVEADSLELMVLESDVADLMGSDDIEIDGNSYALVGVPVRDGTGFSRVFVKET